MQMWKQNRTLFEYFRFMGYLMMIVGVYLLVGGIGDYADPARTTGSPQRPRSRMSPAR